MLVWFGSSGDRSLRAFACLALTRNFRWSVIAVSKYDAACRHLTR